MTERQQTLLRILNLMQQGTVTPEEAADLIDALYEVAPSAPPTADETNSTHADNGTAPARGLFDQILRAVEETARATGQAVRSVNWRQIGQSVREQTQRSPTNCAKRSTSWRKGTGPWDGGASMKPTCSKRWTSRLMGTIAVHRTPRRRLTYHGRF